MFANARGFTLIEMVAVVALLGVIAVTVLPRLSGTNSAEVLVLKDQLLAAIRFTQQKAMFDNQRCYRLRFSASDFAIQSSNDINGSAFTDLVAGSFAEAGFQLSDAQAYYAAANPLISVGGSGVVFPFYIWFDSLGNSVQGALNNCRPMTLQNTITLTLQGESNRTIHVCSTGYATESNC